MRPTRRAAARKADLLDKEDRLKVTLLPMVVQLAAGDTSWGMVPLCACDAIKPFNVIEHWQLVFGAIGLELLDLFSGCPRSMNKFPSAGGRGVTFPTDGKPENLPAGGAAAWGMKWLLEWTAKPGPRPRGAVATTCCGVCCATPSWACCRAPAPTCQASPAEKDKGCFIYPLSGIRHECCLETCLVPILLKGSWAYSAVVHAQKHFNSLEAESVVSPPPCFSTKRTVDGDVRLWMGLLIETAERALRTLNFETFEYLALGPPADHQLTALTRALGGFSEDLAGQWDYTFHSTATDLQKVYWQAHPKLPTGMTISVLPRTIPEHGVECYERYVRLLAKDDEEAKAKENALLAEIAAEEEAEAKRKAERAASKEERKEAEERRKLKAVGGGCRRRSARRSCGRRRRASSSRSG